MQPRKKNKKVKAAQKRSERILLFFKRGFFTLLIIAIGAATLLGLKIFTDQLRVEKIIVSGNYHLDQDDILKSMAAHKGESLLDLHFEDVGAMLKKNPWIRNVALRKQYPDTIEIKIVESEPKALFTIKGQLYLINEEGNILEKIEGETIPFLPVIKNIEHKNIKDLTEALKLVEALNVKKDFISRESVEIGLESYGLTVTIDGDFIKVGYGSYREKFERWLELEPEIRKRGVPIKYVDLRFKDSVIIKPLEEYNENKEHMKKATS